MTSGSDKRIRQQHLPPVRVSADEFAAISAAAESAGLALSSYIRQVLLGMPVARQVRRKPADHRELARILGALGHIGANLNQLAKASNSGVLLYAGEVGPAAAAVVEMRDALMAALGHEP